MDALKIALETIIVGALAISWLLLLIDLFCPERERLLKSLIDRLADKATSTAAGVFLFALAYLMGASVARVADDFFNDDDLGPPISEDDIRTEVYCDPTQPWLVPYSAVLIDKDGKRIDSNNLCPGDREARKNNVQHTYAVQEASLLLTSSGNTDRIRYLHQQHVVLRGVAFDALVATLLLLFGVCAKHGRTGRRVLSAISLLILLLAVRATVHHFGEHSGHLVGAPPLMEITLILFAIAGFALTRRDVLPRPYECAAMFSAVLAFLAVAGWWYSEILYDHTMIYFFYAHTHASSFVP